MTGTWCLSGRLLLKMGRSVYPLAIMVMAKVLVTGCGPSENSRLHIQADPWLRAEQYWQNIAPKCGGHPSKEHCDDGDMTLFNGLLCASGIEAGCHAVQKAQDDRGRWWRSPRRLGDNLGKENSFSRDMSLGSLHYLITTQDRDAAKRWLKWIKHNRACMVKKPWGDGCIVSSVLYRLCKDDTDQRCTITPVIWALLGEVWQALGLERTREMKVFSRADDLANALLAEHSKPGYRLHLKGVSAWLLQRIRPGDRTAARIIEVLIQRQPENLFFRYLHEGASDDLKHQLLERCPSMDSPVHSMRQWAWERADSSEAWEESMVWDCLFLKQLVDRHPKQGVAFGP